jgi:hypothetical protein
MRSIATVPLLRAAAAAAFSAAPETVTAQTAK